MVKQPCRPSGMMSDLLKFAGATGMRELLRLFQGIMGREHAPDEWRTSLTIPLHKGKGDALQCEKYRGLRLLEHGMKVWERVLNEKLKQVTSVGKNQFGFRVEKSTTGVIFIVQQLQEKYLEKRKKLYHIFVDLEKAFDKIPHTAIRWALHRQRVPERLINSVMALYRETGSSVKVVGETSVDFGIEVGVHQGSVLSSVVYCGNGGGHKRSVELAIHGSYCMLMILF